MQGLWTATFNTPLGIGYGVAYFTANQVSGGDSAFTYIGTYTETSGRIEAKLRITPFNNSTISVFGSGSAFDLTVMGNINGNKITGTGSASSYPGVSFAVSLTKVA